MAMSDNLKTIVAKQKDILSELEKESIAIAENDLTKENDALKTALEKLKADYSHAEDNLKIVSQQNNELKNALYEQIYNEKLSILKMSETKLNIYFKSNYEGELDKLTAFENRVKDRIHSMTALIKTHNVDTRDEIQENLDSLSNLLEQKMSQARAEMAKNTGAFSDNEKAEFEALKNEQIAERQIIDSAKKNNIEAFIGLNLINKLGILLIIIGVIAASQYAYKQMPDFVKSIMMFSLGGLMIVSGEILSRKKANVFSIGMTAGGIGVSYVALVMSSLVLKLPFFVSAHSIYPALFTIILITAVAFYLSQRYNSQTIAAFAMVGGYLPIFKVGGDLKLLYYAMIYFIALNLFALLLSIYKKWTVSSYVGLALNIAGTIYICIAIADITVFNSQQELSALKFGLPQIATITYVFFAFIIYTLIPVFGTYFKKSRFNPEDIVLLGANTLFSSVFMVSIFYIYDLNKYLGLLAFAFAVIYLSVGFFIQSKFKHAAETQALFYITGFVFIILIVPFQFGKMWLTLGWLLEGLALTLYGILKDQKVFKNCGYIIDSLCLGSFIFVDLMLGLSGTLSAEVKYDLFAYKYSLITLGTLLIMSAFIYKKSVRGEFQTIYKYLVTLNFWAYLIFISYKLLNDIYSVTLIKAHYSSGYFAAALAITFTFILAFIAPRIRIVSDLGMEIISMVMYGVGIIWLFVMTSASSPMLGTYRLNAAGTIILIFMGLMSVYALVDLMKTLVMEKQVSVEWYPLLVSSYFVIILTQNLIAQYNLKFSSVWLSIIYVATALAWIIFGFVRRYKFIRVFGLCLSFLAVAKLFIIDLYGLKQNYRIISYFALGIAFLAISFIYQYFNKRLEMKEETVKNIHKS